MTDQVNITTASGALLIASRAKLVAHSVVFSDLLELPPSEMAGEPIALTLSESTEVFFALLAVISGDETRRKKVLHGLPDEIWEGLAKAGDKYDCEMVRLAVQSRVWELAHKEKSPLSAFTLATYLDDAELMNETAFNALGDLLAGERCGASTEWQEKLRHWGHRLKLHASTLAALTPPPAFGEIGEYCHPDGPCTPFALLSAWHDAVRHTIVLFDHAGLGFEQHAAGGAVAWGLCEYHTSRAVNEATNLEEAFWAQKPDFV
ncbi:hypothetical protein JCM6882_000934 [Rhodosporidiobolus microsporus]